MGGFACVPHARRKPKDREERNGAVCIQACIGPRAVRLSPRATGDVHVFRQLADVKALVPTLSTELQRMAAFRNGPGQLTIPF